MSSAPAYKLTYSTMFNPPDELHRQFEQALSRVRGGFGRTHPMWIDGAARTAASTFELRSPIDRDCLLGHFQQGTAADAQDAVAAARRAFPAGRPPPGASAWRCCAAPRA
jgi:1-pyrroline-5-carboxylate dehydrogenase